MLTRIMGLITAETMSSAFSIRGLMFYIEDMFTFAPWLLEFIETAATNVYAVISQSGVQILIFPYLSFP